jgi:hypothetical protein
MSRCFDLLAPGGELVFIARFSMFKMKSNAVLLNKMYALGSFTHVYRPGDDNLFDKVFTDPVVFRYCKDPSLDKRVMFNDEQKFVVNNGGNITFADEIVDNELVENWFMTYTGFISKAKKVFQNEELGNYKLKTKFGTKKFIIITKFPCESPEINNYLLENKPTLINASGKNEQNWFKWASLSNFADIEKNLGKNCIYIQLYSKDKCIATVGVVDYFDESLAILLPKKNVMPWSLQEVCDYMNSNKFQQNYLNLDIFTIDKHMLEKAVYPRVLC